jgi:hypothetical protein
MREGGRDCCPWVLGTVAHQALAYEDPVGPDRRLPGRDFHLRLIFEVRTSLVRIEVSDASADPPPTDRITDTLAR